MKTDEIQPRSRSIQAARFCYYASLAVGFPLWLLTTFVLIIWVGLGILPPADIGPIEMSSPSALQTGVLRGAAVLFFVVYPLSFLWAYRLNHQPWVVFAVMLLPALTFVYAFACFPGANSDKEETTCLIYLGSLSVFLTAGIMAASIAHRAAPVKHAR